MGERHRLWDVDLEELVLSRGGLVERQGEKIVGLCPFHENAELGLELDARAGTWTCSICRPEPGDAADWIMRADGVGRRVAMEMLRTGIALERPAHAGENPKVSTAVRLAEIFDGREDDGEMLAKVAGFYHEELLRSDEALGYLAESHIERRAVEAFRLGYANGALSLRIPKTNRVVGRRVRDRLVELGVFRKETRHEQLRGALVVPLFDREGRVVELYGRRLERQRSKEREKDLWLTEERRGLFNARALAEAKEIVVTSNVVDALVLWSSGIEHVTAMHGLDGAAGELLELVAGARTRRVVLAYPRTPAAAEAARRLGRQIASLDVEVLEARFPKDMDARLFARSEEDASYRLGELVRGAEWVGGVARAEGAEDTPRPAEASPVAAAAEARSTGREEPGERAAEEGLVYRMGDRRWRVRGLEENTARGTLKVNLFVSRAEGFHVDNFDLYSSRHRTAFIKQAASELGLEEALVKRDLGQVLLRLEEAQEEMLRKLRAPSPKQHEMSDDERRAALELLRDPKLLGRVLEAFRAMGIVGEEDNLLAGYLVSVSRKLRHPLAMVIQSSSAAGKSSLLDAILRLVPEEDAHAYSAMTGQSLYYMGQRSLRHRVLSIAEEAGVEKASYAMKLLQSAGELTIASTGKEAASGRIVSHEYKVEGPVALMITTSKVELDEELTSRALVVTIDESPEQTKAVHEAQKEAQTLEGLLREATRGELERLHQNAQRLLRPVAVVNPNTDAIEFGDRRVRARRDHRKLLSLIEAIALAHQHQRPLRRHEIAGRAVEYIEATESDVALAERLMTAVVGTALDDLAPRTERLLRLLGALVVGERARRNGGGDKSSMTLTRRQIRDALGWGDTQLKTHLRRLVDAELVLVHRAAHGKGVVYELAFEDDLHERSTSVGDRSAVGRASVGPRSGLGRGGEIVENDGEERANRIARLEGPEIARRGAQESRRPRRAARAS